MEFLPVYMFVMALIELVPTARMLFLEVSVGDAVPAVGQVLPHSPYAVVLLCWILLTAFVIRLHLAFDIHNKGLYRVALWFHMLEFLGLIAAPIYLTGEGYQFLLSDPILTATAVVILLGHLVWPVFRYRYYLIDSVKIHED